MEDLPFDENAKHTKTPPISPSKWWEMKMDDSPSDEASQYILEAASFEHPSVPPLQHKRTSDSSKQGKQAVVSTPTLPKRRYTFAHHRMFEDPFKPHTRGDELDFCQGSTDLINKGSSAILDILEKNVCNVDLLDSPTIRRIENSLTLSKLEEQLEKMNHPALWKILGRDMPEEDHVTESDHSSRPPTPIASRDTSFDDLDILSDLENDETHLRMRIDSDAKTKKTTAVPESVCSRLNRAGYSKPERALESTARPLTPRNNSEERNFRRKQYPVLSKPKRKHKSTDIKEKVKIVIESRERNDTNVDRVNPGIPSTVARDALEHANLTDDVISSLTEERNSFFSYLHHFDDDSRKTCVPPVFQKRLALLKTLKIIRSGSNASTRMSGSSPMKGSTNDSYSSNNEDASSTPYVYDYESMNHAYVAYFRRGKPAPESLRLYEHPSPEVFVTMKSEVVVKIDSATVSCTDCVIRQGKWWGDDSLNPLTLPIVPGTSFSGRLCHIDRSLSSKTGLKMGDRVISLVRVGANSRHLCIDSERLVRVPPDYTKESHVACLPEIYLSAFQALHLGQRNAARYRKTSLTGKTILILGGATTMGQALIEVALAAGATNVHATGKDKELRQIGIIGGLPLSKDPRHWLSVMIGKVDMICSLDHPYHKTQLTAEHIQTLNTTGRIVVIGAPEKGDQRIVDLDSHDGKQVKRKLHSYNVFESWDEDMRQAKRDLNHLMKLLKEGLLMPKIAERIPLNKVPKAHEYFDDRQVNGFVICEPWIKGKRKSAFGE